MEGGLLVPLVLMLTPLTYWLLMGLTGPPFMSSEQSSSSLKDIEALEPGAMINSVVDSLGSESSWETSTR